MPSPRILILGGGYAGVLAANRIAGRLGRRARIALISDRDDLVHRVRLHEVIAGRRWKRYPLARLLARRVERVRARVTRIDHGARLVTLDDGTTRAYDHVVIALGSRPTARIPGAAAHASGLASLEAALALRDRLAALTDEPVVVVGGGLTAIETATEIAEAYPRLRVTIATGVLAPSLSDQARAYVRDVLADLRIEVRDGVRVTAFTADAVALADGTSIAARVAIDGAGLDGACPCPTDLPLVGGRLAVDAALAIADGAWGCGDAAAPPPGLPFLRMACASAMPMAAHVADNVVRAVRGDAIAPFRFGMLGQCVSLGRRRGVIQRSDPRDAPTGAVYTGRTAALIKELLCRYVIGSLRIERRFAGTYRWPRAVAALPPGDALALPGAVP